jgi:hypothetical protein
MGAEDYIEGYNNFENEETPDWAISDDELLKAIREELDGATQSNEAQDFEEAVDYFDAKLPAPMDDDSETEYSDVVSEDVRNAVEATMAEILPGFYGDSPVMFMPNGPNDERQAAQETHAVNHVFLTSNKGYVVLARSIKDALLKRSAVAKVYWDARKEVRGSRLKNQPPEMQMAVQATLDKEITKIYINGDGTIDMDIVETINVGKPVVQWVPADELLVNADHDDVSLDSARLVAWRREVLSSDLIAAGFNPDLVDGLSDFTGTEMKPGELSKASHKSNRRIVIVESYYKVDYDGDGIAETNLVVTGGSQDGDQKLLYIEPVPEQPFAHGVAYFSTNSWRGYSLFDRLKSIQDYKSDMMRQILDAGWRNLRQRIGVLERMVNMDDMRDSIKGGLVRIKDPNAVVPFDEVRLPPQIFSILDMLDKQRRESGGGAIDSAPNAQEMGADSAHGVERIMSAIEQTDAAVAKNIAETLVVDIYQKLHRVLRSNWQGVITTRMEGTWMEQVPQQWVERTDVSIAVGLSTGTRLRNAQMLAQVIEKQDMAMQAGMAGTLIGEKQMYLARVDSARMAGIPHPEKYWVDPESPEAKDAARQKAESARQQAMAAQQQAQQQMELMYRIEEMKAKTGQMETQIKAQADQYKADLSHIEKTIDQRLKLIELNAKFDEEEVPNETPDS